ncbi:hypothetical protein [Quadrisphaera sp. INWT6]|uniref:hypothetical protein n=1 Tax=Quadrisphaera sp. INWT6 TaxID=2596917 RepID=UPI00189200F5|nr:hypothetical protein [Quadrisphaera sp. INWT6]MBF5082583.1 hypothetical protein [Quadrisphaera sp. INWT6]
MSTSGGRPCGGPTEATNLQLLAQVEHLLKQAGEHARPGHGWSVAVDRTGPPPDDGSPPQPSPGDGVRWTSPTGHTYRVSPQRLLDTDLHLADGNGDGGDGDGGGGSTTVRGLPLWVHSLLADVLPAWVGWPTDGLGNTGGPGAARAAPAAWPVDWARDWARDRAPDRARDCATDGAADEPPGSACGDSSDRPPDEPFDVPSDGPTDEPFLFDDLPAA